MPYAPFHEKFPDIAEHETRSLTIYGDPELPDDKYAFIEAYCDEENCDCRRVFFSVFSENTRKCLAVITYGWEKRKYYIDWMGDNDPNVIDSLVGLNLNLLSPQSKFAPALLRKIDIVLKEDPLYVDRLKKHYKIYRTEIDKQYKTAPLVSQFTVGRNDPCPCGSGKKFKKCCIGEENAS
ncbi:SEC-C metal-binding domain-containing protein [Deltaproteobacteria bacterium TL4]